MAGALRPGSVISGKYEIHGVLGEGGMGVVYNGLHLDLRRPVAIKTLLPSLLGSKQLVARFIQEARTASSIGHPNIINVFDLDRLEDGGIYLAMELLNGEALDQRLDREGTLSFRLAVGITIQMLAALFAAHKRGVVHRDLKPENLFLCEGDDEIPFLKVLDFGVSKVLRPLEFTAPNEAPSVGKTAIGAVVGTPLYMSPEQAKGIPDIDRRADIWAAGAVLYQMLAGRPPFLGNNYNQVLAAVLSDPVPPCEQFRTDIPPGLAAIIAKALKKEREERYGSAGAMRTDLLAFSRGQDPAGVTSPARPRDPVPQEMLIPEEALAALDRPELVGLDGSAPGLEPMEPPDETRAPTLAPAVARAPAPRPANPNSFAPPAALAEPVLELDFGPQPGNQSRAPARSPAPRPPPTASGFTIFVSVALLALAAVTVLWALKII